MATLVTGGTGFVASNIVRTLAQRGHTVVCLDLAPPDSLVMGYLEPWAPQVTFIQGDILNREDVARAEDYEIDKIVHAAVFTGILPDIERDRSHSIVDINTMGTTNLLELARRLRPERFLYVSSGSVYGEGRAPDDVLREDDRLYPRSLYELTKYASELLTRRYGELHDFQTVSVRLETPYGPMERVTGHRANQSLIKEWTGNVVRGEPIEVGDRTQGQALTYVADIAAGVCSVLDAPSLSHDVYNNSSTEWNTLEEILNIIQGLRPDLRVVDVPDKEPVEISYRMDVTRLLQDVGFVPEYDTASGIRHYFEWRQETGFTE